MSSPLVSAILPVYNGAKTIRAALDSALAQTYRPIEIIVIDDASTDDTVRILDSYGSAIRRVRRDRNSGVCAVARAHGMELAAGTYHAFLDQDDLWEPAKIERQVAFLEARPDIPLCHTYMRVIDGEGRPLEIRHEGKIPPTGPCAVELLHHCFITISSILVRPEAWIESKRVVGMDHANADTETFLDLLRRYPAGFGFIPEVLGSYRRWPDSMSRQQWRWSPEDVDALERVYARGFWKGLVEERTVRAALANACRQNAEYHRHRGFPGRALYFARKGLQYSAVDSALYASALKAIVQGIVRGQGFALETRAKPSG